MRRNRLIAWASCAVVAAGGAAAVAWGLGAVDAADHLDPPARTDPMATPPGTDRAGDIADLYAWHDSSAGTATFVMTFAGPVDAAADQAITCDRDVLYTIHLDTDDDNTSDIDVHARFGEDDIGNCFLEVENVPGTDGDSIEGRVEHVISSGEAQIYAGLRDDPFFFDLQGFRDTLSSGDLSFVSDRDFFALKNSSALVVEVPLSAVSSTGDPFRVWATTSRIGG